MARKPLLFVNEVFGSDSSDNDSDNGSGDISDEFREGDALLSDDDLTALMTAGRDTSENANGLDRDSEQWNTNTPNDNTPNIVSINASVPKRLIAARNNDATTGSTENRPTANEYQSSTQPLRELTNHSVDTREQILMEIKKANSRLEEFAKNLETIETRLTSVEEHCLSATPSSSSCIEESGGKIKRKVPAKVSVCLASA